MSATRGHKRSDMFSNTIRVESLRKWPPSIVLWSRECFSISLQVLRILHVLSTKRWVVPVRHSRRRRWIELIASPRENGREGQWEADEHYQGAAVCCASVLFILHHVSLPSTLFSIRKLLTNDRRLLFMTYNGWIMLAVAVGAFVGYLLFSNSPPTKTAACHWGDMEGVSKGCIQILYSQAYMNAVLERKS